MFNTVLVAVDDSDAAQAAIELGCKLAKLDGAKLLLVNAVDASKIARLRGTKHPIRLTPFKCCAIPDSNYSRPQRLHANPRASLVFRQSAKLCS
ncbi:MAG: universal stress protein [Candidatus Aquilonibacter sp.]